MKSYPDAVVQKTWHGSKCPTGWLFRSGVTACKNKWGWLHLLCLSVQISPVMLLSAVLSVTLFFHFSLLYRSWHSWHVENSKFVLLGEGGGVVLGSTVSMPTLNCDFLWFHGIDVGRDRVSPLPPILLMTHYALLVFFTLPTQFGPVNKQRGFQKIVTIEFCNEDTVGPMFDKCYIDEDLDLSCAL
jgi:hypothetical protein